MSTAWEQQTEALVRRCYEQLDAVCVRAGAEPREDETPLDIVAAIEEGGAEDEVAEALREGRTEGVRLALEFVFQDGCDPAVVMRRLYATVSQLAPELIHGMTFAEQAEMFGETRSAVSGRIRRLFKDTAVRGRNQKRQSAVERMREAQRGNSNRKNGEKKRRVLEFGERGEEG